MTPAIRLLEQSATPHEVLEYHHDPAAPAYGEEAARMLALDPTCVYKTLLAKLDSGQLVVALVPVTGTLDLKALARAAGAKKATMAEAALAERTTGYVVGGISPLGQKKRLPTYLDASAAGLEKLHVSGGRRGLEVGLAPQALVALTDARLVPLAKR
ncbi:Cys-tRNA(Pro) deacylase [Halomonas shantousis]